jgi:flagellar biosynthesis protein FlhG
MPDQAAGLRSLFARRRPSLLVVAGSDPAKAAIALHFAREAATNHRATVIVDGTPGRVATACDMACRYELAHVVAGDVELSAVVRTLTPDLLLLPAARALARFGSFSADEEARLSEVFAGGMTAALASGGDAQIDLIVVHVEEMQAARAIDAFGRDARVVIVVSDDGPSLRGAYAEMKSLVQQHAIENFEIVTPVFDGAAPAGRAFANLAAAARRFLRIDLVDGGAIRLPKPHGNARPGAILPAPLPSTTEEASHAAIA